MTFHQVPQKSRTLSIDALRGFVVLVMLFVDDLALAPKTHVPAWMRHYAGASGMYFPDVVFPAFLFIVGMSVPFALQSRIDKGEPLRATLTHIFTRTASLLLLGLIIVNGDADSVKMGWSASLWGVLARLSAIVAFVVVTVPRDAGEARTRRAAVISATLSRVGLVALVALAFSYRGADGHRIVSLAPFSIHADWWGILGQIGWAYFIASVVYLIVRGRAVGLSLAIAVLLSLYVADKKGLFDSLWVAKHLSIGESFGSQSGIALLGVLLSVGVRSPEWSPMRKWTFAAILIGACALAATAFQPAYGVSKDDATPSWALWSSAILVALWLVFYRLTDARTSKNRAGGWLASAGQNVLLAYLLRDLFVALLPFLSLDVAYQGLAAGLLTSLVRSTAWAFAIVAASMWLNRKGVRVKL